MQKAIQIASAGAPFVVGTRPIPKPGKGQMLVKILAVALNPFEVFMSAHGMFVREWPVVLGWDASGRVEEVGEGVVGFEKGDRVVYPGDFVNDRFTFQEYGLTNASTTAKIPNNLTFEQAATFPLGISTSAIGLYSKKQVGAGLVAPWEADGKGKYQDEPILVTGGASSVGQFAIQLAKLSGFNPIITTASASNKAYCEAAGATHVIDYHTTSYSALPSAVRGITSKPIKVIYDAISTQETQVACWGILSDSDGKLVVTRPLVEDIKEENGKSVARVFGTVNDDTAGDARVGEQLFGALEKLLRDGDLKPNAIEVLPGGLAGIEGGLKRMAEGKVSGTKLVARPTETS